MSSSNFLSSFEKLDETSVDFLDRLMEEAISERDKLKKIEHQSPESDTLSDELDKLIDELSLDEKKVDEKKVDDEHKYKFTKFRHSINGVVVRGPNKGRNVEVKYYTPGKFEVEIGINEEIFSRREFMNGDMVDNCVILAKLGTDKYLGHCKKVTFLKKDDIRFIGDGQVEITRGPLSGIHGIIRKEYKSRLGIIMDFRPLTVDEDDIFYKDVLLKNDKFFNVKNVKLDKNNDYVITGIVMGDSELTTIGMDDIKEMMSGFKIGKGIKDVEEEVEVDDGISYRHSEGSEEEESIASDSDLSEMSESRSGDYVSSFRDVERTSKVFSGWSLKQKSYVDLVTKILNIELLNEEDIDMYEVVERVELVLKMFDKRIVENGENFDIFSSSIDIQMIISCVMIYKLVTLIKKFTLGGYINRLYNKGYFSGSVVGSVLVEFPEIFKCKLKRTKLDFERITMLMNCYNDLIQEMLGIKLEIRDKQEDVEKLIKVVPKEKDVRSMILSEELLSGMKIDSSNMGMNIVWGPHYKSRIEKWRDILLSKVRASSGLTSRVYDFIQNNIENSPTVLYKLRGDVIEYLSIRNNEFSSVIGECGGDRVCEDAKIDVYIKKIMDEILDKKGKGRGVTQSEYEMLQKYIRMVDFVKEFLADMSKLREYIKSKQTKRLEDIRLERESLLEKRRLAMERKQSVKDSSKLDKIKDVLKGTFKDKFDETCEDEACKIKEVVSKVKRVLSNQEQMLLTSEEVDLFKEFMKENSEVEQRTDVSNEHIKVPKIILRLKKPQEEQEKQEKTGELEERPKLRIKLKMPNVD